MSAACKTPINYHAAVVSALNGQVNPNVLIVGANPTDHGHQHMISFLEKNFANRSVTLYTASPDNYTETSVNHIDLDLNSLDSVTEVTTKYKDFFTLVVVDVCVLCHLSGVDMPNFYKLFSPMIVTGGMLVTEAPSFSDVSVKTKKLRDQYNGDGFVLSENGLVMIYEDLILNSVPEMGFYLTHYDKYVTTCMKQVYAGGGYGLMVEIPTYVPDFNSVYPLKKFHQEAQNLFVKDLTGCYSQIHFYNQWIFSPVNNECNVIVCLK